MNKSNKPNNSTVTLPNPDNQTTESAVLEAKTKAKRKAAKGTVDFSIGARAVIRKDATWN